MARVIAAGAVAMVVLGGTLGAVNAQWDDVSNPVVVYEATDSFEAQGTYGQIPGEPMDSYIPSEPTDFYIPSEPLIPGEPSSPLYYTQ
jgi:hypothetical protein